MSLWGQHINTIKARPWNNNNIYCWGTQLQMRTDCNPTTTCTNSHGQLLQTTTSCGIGWTKTTSRLDNVRKFLKKCKPDCILIQRDRHIFESPLSVPSPSDRSRGWTLPWRCYRLPSWWRLCVLRETDLYSKHPNRTESCWV